MSNAERHMRHEQEIERAASNIVSPAEALPRLAGISFENDVQHGPVAATLIKRANNHEVKQIAVGRLGQSGMKNLIFGSVAGSLIQASPVPVFVVP